MGGEQKTPSRTRRRPVLFGLAATSNRILACSTYAKRQIQTVCCFTDVKNDCDPPSKGRAQLQDHSRQWHSMRAARELINLQDSDEISRL